MWPGKLSMEGKFWKWERHVERSMMVERGSETSYRRIDSWGQRNPGLQSDNGACWSSNSMLLQLYYKKLGVYSLGRMTVLVLMMGIQVASASWGRQGSHCERPFTMWHPGPDWVQAAGALTFTGEIATSPISREIPSSHVIVHFDYARAHGRNAVHSEPLKKIGPPHRPSRCPA